MNTTKQVEEINWNGVDESAQDRMSLQLPLVFWRHGKKDMKELGEQSLAYRGGLFFGFDAAGEGATIELWSEARFEGEKGEVRGLAASVADLAFVRSRRRWFRRDSDSDRTEFRPWSGYQAGFRGQLQIVGFVKGYELPVCFSFKGLLGQAIEAVQREHLSKVVALINRTAPEGKSLPPYAVWTRIKSGKHERVGSGRDTSEVTMPEIFLPPAVDLAFARSRFVGNENLARFQELYLGAADWAREWDYPGMNGDAKHAPDTASQPPRAIATGAQATSESNDYMPDFEGAPPDDDEPPF